MLVTGVKRDMALRARVPAQGGDSVTVLDVSLARNRDALAALPARGAEVRYFDHHFAGDVPVHPRLHLWLDTAPEVCTSVLVNRYLGGHHKRSAIVGAFGDNLPETAQALARSAGREPAAAEPLRILGEAINYNAYGDSEADLLVPPPRLYERMRRQSFRAQASQGTMAATPPASVRILQGTDEEQQAAQLVAGALLEIPVERLQHVHVTSAHAGQGVSLVFAVLEGALLVPLERHAQVGGDRLAPSLGGGEGEQARGVLHSWLQEPLILDSSAA